MAVERASKIVFALKSYARQDNSGQMSRVSVTERIDVVLTIYQNLLKQGIEVIKNYGEVPAILCYPEELNQVWKNLIHNAIQAMNNKGKLEIAVAKPDRHVVVILTDSGCGIPDKILARIFEPFFTTKPAGEGSGLGLDIVIISEQIMPGIKGDELLSRIHAQYPKTLKILLSGQASAEAVGNAVNFDFEISLGSTVEIQTPQLTRRVIGLEAGQPEYRILVVDDRFESRLLLVKLLASLGFLVRSAENGQEAVDLWNAFEPHLIWMDMRMPVMDGYEATKSIKADLKGRATVIIALTASAFEEERHLVLSAGCDDFVRKPFREQVIFEKMAQYLGVRYIYEEPAHVEGTRCVSARGVRKAENQIPPLSFSLHPFK